MKLEAEKAYAVTGVNSNTLSLIYNAGTLPNRCFCLILNFKKHKQFLFSFFYISQILLGGEKKKHTVTLSHIPFWKLKIGIFCAPLRNVANRLISVFTWDHIVLCPFTGPSVLPHIPPSLSYAQTNSEANPGRVTHMPIYRRVKNACAHNHILKNSWTPEAVCFCYEKIIEIRSAESHNWVMHNREKHP